MIEPEFWEELGIIEDLTAQYMEYPDPKSKRRYVIQHHWRGRSVHKDLRMEFNDHLIGWTILDNPAGTPKVETMEEAKRALKELDWGFVYSKMNKGLRAEEKCYSDFCDEWKYDIISYKPGEIVVKEIEIEVLSEKEELARQPKDWLEAEGVVRPGEVGATAENIGVIHIIDKGHFWEGAQKPYFHEYFFKSDVGTVFPKDKYVRVIFRGVKVPVIDPETKKPKKGQYELMWRVMIPSDQVAYALKRGMKKGWVPPKGVIPVPPDQRQGELWEKWYAWVKDVWAGKKKVKEEKPEEESLSFTCEECVNFEYCTRDIPPETPACDNFDLREGALEEDLAKGKFTLHVNTYMGQIVIRAIPHIEHYFRLQTDKGVFSWYIGGNPMRAPELPATFEGKVDKKWMTFEGEIKPGEPYNPTKTLTARMRILDTGPCDYEIETDKDGKMIFKLELRGKALQGNFVLEQEEKGSDIFVWKAVEKLEILSEAEFVLHRHYWDNKQHWDIRVKLPEDPKELLEWNLYGNPLEVDVEEPIRAVIKTCRQPEKWFITEGKNIMRTVGGLETYIDVIDHGKMNIIEASEGFMSMKFFGNKLTGYWVLKRNPIDNQWYFIKSKLPEPQKEAEQLKGTGDPLKGDYFEPFKKIQKQGWSYYWLEIYDLRNFTRCVENPEEYIPEVFQKKPKEILDILVCLYSRPGKIHGARVSRVKVSEEMDEKEAINWIKKMKLHTWEGEMIRKERKSLTEDEMLMKIIEEELKKRELSPEERKLELELKKKKLELIEKWLEANKDENIQGS